SAARRQPRRTAGRGPPRERRVPPAGAVAEVIREKGPTRVQSRCRRPAVPGPLQRPAFRTGGEHRPTVQEKESPHTTDAVRHRRRGPPPPKKRRGVPHSESPAAWRGGRRGDCSRAQRVSAPSRGLELGSRVILARCPDRSVKKEEEMFLYLECGHFISRIYSRSNTRISSRWSVTSRYKPHF
ncbi:unnamed protein product, partial [Pleuronectes platessa]